MTVISLSRAPSLRSPADQAIRLAGLLVSAYLAATLWPMARYATSAHEYSPLAAHVAAFAVALAATGSARPSLQPLRDWLPLLLGPFLYVELRWLIEGVGRPHADVLVHGWERTLFPSDPSATWAPHLPSRALSEVLHLAYASYYLLVYLPPALLYLRGRRSVYADTVLALTVVYAACFLTYLVFPVDGPRFLAGPAPAPEGPIRSFVLHLLAAGSSRGTAFPSSHVAAAVVATVAAVRAQPRVGVAVGLCTAGLAVSTVYGGFHYAVDALAGVVYGTAAALGAGMLSRALGRPSMRAAGSPSEARRSRW